MFPWALSNYTKAANMKEIITEEESVFLSQHIASAEGPKTGVFYPTPPKEVYIPAQQARISRQFFLFRQRVKLKATSSP